MSPGLSRWAALGRLYAPRLLAVARSAWSSLVVRTLLGGSQTESTGRHGAGYTVRVAAHRCVDRVSFPLVFMGEVTNVFRSPRLLFRPQ